MELEALAEDKLRELESKMGMTPEGSAEDVASLRGWIKAQPHLPQLSDDDETNEWLRNFLVFCKNRLEKAKHNLDHYFSCRSLVPELFAERDPSSAAFAANVKALFLFPLPKLTPDGYRVHVFCHAVPDASAYDADAFMRRALVYLDWKIREDVTAGDIFVFHLKHSSLAHLGKYNFSRLSRFIASAINGYPLRIKAIHFTMAPSFVSYFISNPFITDKIKKRIRVHAGTDVQDLLAEIPSDCLPRELGGAFDCSMEELNDVHHRRLVRSRDWLIGTGQWKSDESRRPPEMRSSDLFGCEGTFRALNVD